MLTSIVLLFFWNLLLDILFPKFCCGCEKMDTYLCPSCFNTISFLSLPVTLSLKERYITQILSVTYYEGVVKKLLHTFKYEGIQEIARILSQFIYYTKALPEVDILTVVPIHSSRLKERGFNQSELLAQELSRICDLPYISLLERIEFTKPQAQVKNKEDRLKNVEKQFAISRQIDQLQKNISGKKILIIDDVCTTGATLNECARILKNFGAESVYGFTIAHGG